MKLWEDAARMTLFGVKVYSYGTYCAFGAIFALLAYIVICRYQKIKTVSALMSGMLSILFGLLFSRIVFCILDHELGRMIPVSEWFRISTGGWTMFGMIGGAMSGAWLGAKIMKEKPARILDAVSAALLLMIVAERLGESRIERFNVSRPLTSGIPEIGFLTVKDELETRVATHRVAAILTAVLFVILVICLFQRKRRDGDLWILFLLLFGAVSVLLESLRLDNHLVYSFVRMQQVLAALMLLWGLILAGRRGGRKNIALIIISFISFMFAVGVCILNEFRLDRTQVSHILLYVEMIAALLVPTLLGVILLMKGRAEQWEKA